MTAADLRRGQMVRLRTPDNPYLDGQTVRILRVTEYGALVEWPASASGTWRALLSEMESMEKQPTGEVCSCCGGANLFRAGACMTCGDCGTSAGCG